jgi:two-component system chemotaxis sensor kinase CheA
MADESVEQGSIKEEETTTLLVFLGGGAALKAVPLSLVTRLEEIDAGTIEWTGGRPLVQYRGKLMPLIACDEGLAIKQEGSQSLVVFSDGDLSLGLAVEEIIDIVDDKLDIELVADRSDLVGSAVIRGRATEVVNLAHYLPLVAEAWMRSAASTSPAQTVLLVDGSAFFRDMLTPVLKASGYRVVAAANGTEALQVLASGTGIDVLVSELELPDRSGFDLVAALRASSRYGALPVIGLTVKHDPRLIALAHKLNITEMVGKFDRRGLLAALSELHGTLEEAA